MTLKPTSFLHKPSMSVTFRGDKTAYPFTFQNGEVCMFCRTAVFPDSLRRLLDTATGEHVEIVYHQPCSGAYTSYLADCPWCTMIAKIVVFTVEYMKSLDADSDDDDYEPDYVTLPMADMDCAAILEVAVQFSRPAGGSSFGSITVKVEIPGTNHNHCYMPRLDGRDALHLAFKVSSDGPSSPLRWLTVGTGLIHVDSPLFQRHWGRISADCDDWVLVAQNWLSDCAGHQQCRRVGSFMPSRVLDVTTPSLPKLVSRDSIPSSKDRTYSTLSYVWGTAQPYVLTSHSEGALRQGIDCALLPQTVQDAIHVVSRLNIRYLWVDALCIMQDSLDDKAKELPQMANIYRCSALTISAASANSSSEGFLKRPVVLFYPEMPPMRLPLGTKDDKEIHFMLGHPHESVPGGEPIFSRAWTCQEQLLSHRTLLFERDGVAWECLEHRATYKGTTPVEDTQSILRLCNPSITVDKQAIYERWHSIRMDYCNRDLSFLGDKLNAIAALASEISRSTGWTYLAGLWQEQIIDELLWCYVNPKATWDRSLSDYPILRSPKARASEAVAPSWSWASVTEGPVYYTDTESKRDVFEFRMLDCEIEDTNAGPFGSVKSGTLKLLGKVVMLKFRSVFRPDELDIADIVLFSEHQPESTIAYGATDPLDAALAPDTLLTCLAIARSVVMGKEICEGLMLLPQDRKTYRRIGFFRAYDFSVFEAATQVEIIVC